MDPDARSAAYWPGKESVEPTSGNTGDSRWRSSPRRAASSWTLTLPEDDEASSERKSS